MKGFDKGLAARADRIFKMQHVIGAIARAKALDQIGKAKGTAPARAAKASGATLIASHDAA